MHAARIFKPVDLRDVGMIQRREHLGLALEPREPFRILGERAGQNLQRDVAVELRIARAVNLAHSARPNGGDHFIRTDANAGSK